MKESEKEHCCCHQEHEGEHHCGCGHNHEHNEEHHCCCGHHDHCDDHCECGEKDVNLYDKIRETLDKYSYSLTAEQAEHEAAHIMEHHSEQQPGSLEIPFEQSGTDFTESYRQRRKHSRHG